ncbi:glycosyltransferase family 2 protein [Pyxidicoccus sp. MSG2]|uniref:glycosyltransferase family 2 protein n=1 Tax=Pyxidicoccus sp. MSG2 TaxID=2996790 RepID=UPI00226EAD18|nr:glycosyltransferase [Pyxidicoccus sp. MSG2]MCY1022009.1 glycosyltransferase [Pyxidicoccus sp. MSG2]
MKTRPSEPAWCEVPRRLADTRGLEIPGSHRSGWKGLAVTRAKRLVLRGMEPMQRALLETQCQLNALLVDGLAQLPRRSESGLHTVLASLRQAVAGQWDVPPGVPGRTWVERQRAWNRLAVSTLAEAAEVWPLWTPSLVERCAELAARADVSEGEAKGRAEQLLRPSWRELWRRQVAFHHAFAEALRWAVGIARPRMHFPEPEVYEAWRRASEPVEVSAAAEALTQLRDRPLISLVVPAWRTPEPLLRACLDSVLAQVYPDWELCLVDDGSPDDGVARVVGDYSRRDARIHFERLPRNGGIARATNAAIARCSGALIAFLDHDDTLAPHALAEVALHAQAYPDADVFYSDEDKLDGEGRRYAPSLKPALSPDLLRALNYVCHFVAVRAPLLREVGGLREGFDGAQDHELLLRLSERTSRFVHIPRVLYHWRSHPGSTSMDSGAKPAASEAGRRAVVEHLARLGTAAEVSVMLPGVYRVRYPLAGQPSVSIILHGSAPEASEDLAERALLASLKDTALDVEVLASLDASSSQGAQLNSAAHDARGTLLLFLERGQLPAEPEWLQELVSQALRPELGAVGGLLLGPDGTVDAAGLMLGGAAGIAPALSGIPDPSLTALGGSRWPHNRSAVSATCLMVRRELFDRLGGFDESLSDGAAAVDLCLRLVSEGFRILVTPHARLVRLSLGSAGRSAPEAVFELQERIGQALGGVDPYTHPSSALTDMDESLR